MKKHFTLSNGIFSMVLILMLIPSSRSFIQLHAQKILSAVLPVHSIKESKRELISFNNDFSIKGINVVDLHKSEFNDKVVFINFWATWCPPCIAEMPDLQKVYSKYKKDIVFAFVTSEDKNTVEDFLKKNKYDLPIYNYPISLPKELDHSTIPTSIILDKSGKIAVYKTGVANWNSDSFYKLLNTLIQQ